MMFYNVTYLLKNHPTQSCTWVMM